ncbi:MAG: hypothetical protein A2W91_19790 [Bacteroidetes bacterium GWF2_38_335]|nr:MAG: hypothetical protein A2W91_19790 [Bacteroidetes bacterium GWF2_38_335]OFY79267.1 MAG: hypothetical protein A2281_15865 [Bacteroidetes bacterium RIFOXYA12_FULL_38_20]HBS86460.1 hypothetical protein [Bacteroidales bacterium]
MKARFFLVILFLIIFIDNATAQNHSINGTILSGSGDPLPGASVVLKDNQNHTVNGTTSNANGFFELSKVAPGNYKLSISFLGFTDTILHIAVKSENIQTGTIRLKEQSNILNEVVVLQNARIVEIKGDTSEYKTQSFKTNPDATAEDLIKKMPGVSIENGTVNIQGEEVKKVLVNGKEFIGNDASVTLKTIPAEMIEAIQVYDEMSEQAKFTGFNDGETSKTVNLKTFSNKSKGTFGKVFAGYGTDERYSLGGNINIFNGDRRISILGMSNNINQQNFSSQDLFNLATGGRGGSGRMGGPPIGGNIPGPPSGTGGMSENMRSPSDFLVGQNSGINTNNSLGINYVDLWGKKWDVSGSYFYNSTINNTTSTTDRTYFLDNNIRQYYDESSESIGNNYNHRINARVEYKIDSMNSLLIIPSMNIQKNKSNSNTNGLSYYALNDLLNSTENSTDNDVSGYNFSNNLLFRHKFDKSGRTLSVSVNNNLSKKNTDNYLLSGTEYFSEYITTEMTNQHTDGKTTSSGISSNISYTEPVSKTSQLMASWNPSYTKNNSDNMVNQYDSINYTYADLDTLLSNVYRNTIVKQRGGFSIRKNTEKINLNAGIDYQIAYLSGSNTWPEESVTEKEFSNFMPKADMFYHFSKSGFLHLNYRTTTTTPSVNQLQNVIDNSNPLSMTSGNPDLDQQFNHSIHTAYNRTNQARTKMFFMVFSGSISDNYIGNSTFTSLSDTVLPNGIQMNSGSQLTAPVNLEGYKNVQGFFTYGFPVYLIKCNMNVNGSYIYSETPALINAIKNLSMNNTYKGGLSVTSNISKEFDFTLAYNGSYNKVINSIQSSLDENYYTGNLSFKSNMILIKHLVFNNNITYTRYYGLSESYDEDLVIWNMGVGYKFLKNNAAELQLSVYDLLDQNESFVRNVNSSYVEDVKTKLLQQYFMLTLTYNIRNFDAEKEAEKNDMERPPFPPPFKQGI